jgi:hypothetical protein
MCRRVRPGAGVCRGLWTRRGRDLGASPQVRRLDRPISDESLPHSQPQPRCLVQRPPPPSPTAPGGQGRGGVHSGLARSALAAASPVDGRARQLRPRQAVPTDRTAPCPTTWAGPRAARCRSGRHAAAREPPASSSGRAGPPA